MSGRSYWPLYLFTLFMLGVSGTIRSGVLVDKSLLPRVFTLTVVLLITWAVSLIRKKRLTAGRYEWLFLVFCLWSLASSLWAVSSSEAIFRSQLLLLGWIVLLFIGLFARLYPPFEAIFIRTLLVVLLLSFVLAFLKMRLLNFYDPYQIYGISANNNLYSGYLLLSLAFTTRGYEIFKGIWKYLSVLIITGSLFFMVILQSRAVYLGSVAALSLLVAAVVFRYRHLLTKTNLLTLTLALVLLAGSVTLFYLSLDHTRRMYFLSKVPVWNYLVSYDEATLRALREERTRMDEKTGMPEFDHAGSYYENANLRMIFWKKSIPLALSHPAGGVGAGNWKLVVPSVPVPENPDHTAKNYTYSQPHNEFIGVLAELGIPGAILFILLLALPPVVTLWTAFRKKKGPPFSRLLYAVFITGFGLYALFDFPLQRVEHLVLVVSALAFLRARQPEPGQQLPASLPGNKLLTFAVIPIVLLSTLYVCSYRILGEYHTLQIFRNERTDDLLVLDQCAEAETRWYTITPNSLPVAWFEGVAWQRLNKPDQAEQSFRRALTATPYEVRVLNDLATALYQQDKTAEAVKLLKQAIRLDPYFDDARFNLAAIRIRQGNLRAARVIILGCRDSAKKSRFLQASKWI